jgi:hypothetical protein
LERKDIDVNFDGEKHSLATTGTIEVLLSIKSVLERELMKLCGDYYTKSDFINPITYILVGDEDERILYETAIEVSQGS